MKIKAQAQKRHRLNIAHADKIADTKTDMG